MRSQCQPRRRRNGRARHLAPLVAALALPCAAPSTAWAEDAPPTRGGPPAVTPPFEGHPTSLFTASGGHVYALMPSGAVRAVPSGEVKLLTRALADRSVTARVLCAAGGGSAPEADAEEADAEPAGDAEAAEAEPPRIVCLRASSTSSSSGGSTSRALELVDSGGDRSVIDSGSGDGYSIEPLAVHVAADGAVSYAYSVTVTQGQQTVTHQYLVTGGDREEVRLELGDMVSHLADVGAGDRINPPISLIDFHDKRWLLYRSGQSIVIHPVGEKPVEVAPSSLHDIRPVVGEDGFLYVFYHDPKSATARAAVSRNGRTWTTLTLDGRESGWQVDAAAGDDGVYAVYYYFHNSFNKGLRAVRLRDGERVGDPVTVFREDRWNAGWHPHLAIADDGTTWLTYLSNVEDEERVWSRFAAPGGLLEHDIGPSGGWEEEYKDYFLQTGVGGWLTFWHLTDGVPEPQEVGGLRVGKTSYNIGRSVLVSANLEARYAWIDVGLSYAQGVVDDAAESVDDSSGVLNGSVEIEDVLPGHDIKIAGLWGRYRGRAAGGEGLVDEAGAGAAPAAELRTDYIDTQLLALNKWRIKYGVGFTTYRVPASVHAWTSPAGSTAYTYEGSFLRDVRFNDVDLVIGWSKLDYAAKYENHYNNVIFDGAAAVGLTFYSFDAIPTTVGPLTSDLSFHLRFTAMLGWLYFHRWQSLRGFGLYVRPAYTAEFGWTGTASAPDPRDSDSTQEDAALGRVSLLSLRHGPWLDAGVVW